MLGNKPVNVAALDQNEALTGTCSTCNTTIRCPRWQATVPNPKIMEGLWCEQPYAECPCCKSKSPKRQGNRIFLVVEKKPTAEELGKQVVYQAIKHI